MQRSRATPLQWVELLVALDVFCVFIELAYGGEVPRVVGAPSVPEQVDARVVDDLPDEVGVPDPPAAPPIKEWEILAFEFAECYA